MPENLVNNLTCPFCMEPRVNLHKLQNGNYGVWCDYCLKGIPTTDFFSRIYQSDAVDDYTYYIKLNNIKNQAERAEGLPRS